MLWPLTVTVTVRSRGMGQWISFQMAWAMTVFCVSFPGCGVAWVGGTGPGVDGPWNLMGEASGGMRLGR